MSNVVIERINDFNFGSSYESCTFSLPVMMQITHFVYANEINLFQKCRCRLHEVSSERKCVQKERVIYSTKSYGLSHRRNLAEAKEALDHLQFCT